MMTKVQKWGNSQGLRVPKALLQEVNLEVGDNVKVSIQGRKIVIEPTETKRRRFDLRDLVRRMPKNTRLTEIDWGASAGKEAW